MIHSAHADTLANTPTHKMTRQELLQIIYTHCNAGVWATATPSCPGVFATNLSPRPRQRPYIMLVSWSFHYSYINTQTKSVIGGLGYSRSAKESSTWLDIIPQRSWYSVWYTHPSPITCITHLFAEVGYKFQFHNSGFSTHLCTNYHHHHQQKSCTYRRNVDL